VETVQQAQFLRLLRCDQIQGYLYSKPVAEERIPELLTRRFAPSALSSK
jgi:EAL domain-containing protein (putative c-di-GMP-specific phosphodiesterase class I)